MQATLDSSTDLFPDHDFQITVFLCQKHTAFCEGEWGTTTWCTQSRLGGQHCPGVLIPMNKTIATMVDQALACEGGRETGLIQANEGACLSYDLPMRVPAFTKMTCVETRGLLEEAVSFRAMVPLLSMRVSMQTSSQVSTNKK